MTASWREVVLGEVADEITVGHVGPMAARYTPEGITFLRSQNVRRLRLDLSDVKYIPEAFHNELRKSRLRPGDVVVVRTGDPGACAVIPETLDLANCADLVIVRPGPMLDSRFTAYFINEIGRHHVAAHLVGAVQQHFNVGAARTLPMKLPCIEEQRAIAGVLGALDDKIEQNRRTARALERLARAIFRAWFVDFEPVKAKAAGATSFPGMPQPVFDALPARFVDSEIGPVPEGWGVTAIGDVVTVKGGGTPSTKNPEYWDGGTHCWATPKDMSRLSHPVLLDTERRITDAGVESISSGVLPIGTVLMSSRAPVGYLAIAGVPTAINQGFIAMVCDGPLPPVFILNWAVSSMDTIKAHASGTTFPEISKGSFRPLPIVQPSADAVLAYRRTADSLFSLLTTSMRESEQLAEVRDYLLPRLLSGSVRATHE